MRSRRDDETRTQDAHEMVMNYTFVAALPDVVTADRHPLPAAHHRDSR
jgi:hypothetical protein